MSSRQEFKEKEFGIFAQDWKLDILKNRADVIMGQSPPSKFYNNKGIGIPFMQGRKTFGDKYHIIDTWCTQPKRIAKQNSILISVRAPVGDLNIANTELCIGRGLSSINMKNGNNEFLYYLLKNYKTRIISKETGTVFGSINKSGIENLKLPFPSEKEQERIASILSSLDDKIELNNQINKNLEEIAQAIFKHWFIDFEFPDGNGEPYKSSGGEMVDCELGLIPKGWEIKKVGEILKTVLGGTPSRKKKIYWENGKIPWINSGKVNDYRIIEPSEYITELGLEKSSTKLLPKRTTVIAITGATLGKISLLEIDCCANQSIVGIVENNIFKGEYIYFWMKNIINRLIAWQTGGAQQHVNKDNVNKVNILIPNEKILQKYYIQVRPMFNKISSNCFENKNLQRLRDLLLPKLMSGEIRVPINSKVLISKNN